MPMSLIFILSLQAFILGWTIAWLLRGYLEAKRCPEHHSMFIDKD